MDTKDIADTLVTLFGELVDGAPASGAYILNTGDAGMLRSLDTLSAAAASVPTSTGSSIAAHVDHVRYGLSLMNRWSMGENPFKDADWSASWKHPSVTEGEWTRLRTDLAAEASRWMNVLRTPREVKPIELNGVLASIVHLAYHFGAIRQIDSALRGPVEPTL
jgi:hypothetical protein